VVGALPRSRENYQEAVRSSCSCNGSSCMFLHNVHMFENVDVCTTKWRILPGGGLLEDRLNHSV